MMLVSLLVINIQTYLDMGMNQMEIFILILVKNVHPVTNQMDMEIVLALAPEK